MRSGLPRGEAVVLACLALLLGLSVRARAQGDLTTICRGGALTVVKSGTEILCLDNTGKRKPTSVDTQKSFLHYLAVTPDGRVAVVGSRFGEVVVISLEAEPAIKKSWNLKDNVQAVAISPDGKVVAAGTDKNVLTFDASSGKSIQSLEHDDRTSGIGFSPDGKSLAVGTEDGKFRLWSVATGKQLWQTKPHKGDVHCVAFFYDGTKMATGSADGTVCILEAKTGKTLASYHAHRATVWQVAVSPDGKFVGSCGLDECINLWDAENEKNVATEKIDNKHFPGIAFSKTHLFVAHGTAVKLLDLKTRKLSDLRK
jgi:WD40 repeat protein